VLHDLLTALGILALLAATFGVICLAWVATWLTSTWRSRRRAAAESRAVVLRAARRCGEAVTAAHQAERDREYTLTGHGRTSDAHLRHLYGLAHGWRR